MYLYSKTKEVHREHLMVALQTLREHQLYAKLSKCDFWLNKVRFLGHLFLMREFWLIPKKWRQLLTGNN